MADRFEHFYERIVQHITGPTGQCVLILGPELSVNQQGVGYKQFFHQFIKDRAQDSKYLYQDNLFQVKDEYDDSQIVSGLKEFYGNVGDRMLLEMIACIKFPLVINVCPDRALIDIFADQHFAYDSGFFSLGATESPKEFPLPTKERPLIYNIFGDINEEQSLIYSHSKLYQTIQHLLRAQSLPANLEYFVEHTAASFLFLGFKFDSWYYQLLCHKLGIAPKLGIKAKITLASPQIEDDNHVNLIMKETFKVQFAPESPTDCLQKLLKGCRHDLRNIKSRSAYSTFISYAWNDQTDLFRERAVDLIEQSFPNEPESPFKLLRDRNDIRYGDSIDSFMHRIGNGKTVIMVISDKYLRSGYCMTEALRVHNYTDKNKRIFHILMSDVEQIINGENANVSIESPYKIFWHNKCQSLLNDPKNATNGKFITAFEIYKYIEQFIEEVLTNRNLVLDVADITPELASGSLEISPQKKKQFDQFIQDVVGKLKSAEA